MSGVDDFDEYYKSLETFTMAFAEEATGIPESELIKFAEECAKALIRRNLLATGITQQDIGSDQSTAISNLLLVTGNYRCPAMVRIHYVDIIMFKDVVIWKYA